MPAGARVRRRRVARKGVRRRRVARKGMRVQKGGIFPLAAIIPALVAAGKAAALGAVSGGAAYGAKRLLGGRR